MLDSVETLSESLSTRLLDALDEDALGVRPLVDYQGRPFEFFRDAYDVTGWSKMRDIVDAYEDPNIIETHIVACHSVSKTMTCSMLVDYHVNVMGYPCVTTAPTMRQANDLLWQQMRDNRQMAKSRLIIPGTILDGTARMKNGAAKCWAFVPKTQDSAQGIHLDNLLVIVDEAAGVVDWLWKSIVGWVSNPGCQIIAVGNPNTLMSYFREQFFSQRGKTNSKGVVVSRAIEIDAHDSPNVTTWPDGKKKKPHELEKLERPIPALASDEWLEKCAREWGVDSMDYWMKARGKWPDAVDDERAIPMDFIQAGYERTDRAIREGRLDPDDLGAILRMSLDLAGRGRDKCCKGNLYETRYIKPTKYWHEPDTTVTLEGFHLDVADAEPKPQYAAIDANAMGETGRDVLDKYRREHSEMWGECIVNGIDWGANPEGNLKTQRKQKKRKNHTTQHTTKYVHRLWWNLRRGLDYKNRPEEELFYLPTEKHLREAGLTRDLFAAQLNARRCWRNEFNQFFVEPKHLLKERMKEMKGATSTDAGDMCAGLCDDTWETKKKKKKRGFRFAKRT